jgi:hypothetical protein
MKRSIWVVAVLVLLAGYAVGGGYIFVHRFLLEHFASLPRRA